MTAGPHAYGEPEYWDRRYTQDASTFEWYQKYADLRPLFDLFLRRSNRILLVGCGNSALGEDMVNDGYQDVVSIDISSVVIEAMKKKCQDKPALKYFSMDVRDMSTFEYGSFDAVVDKGTLDSLMCGQSAQHDSRKMLKEVGRVLKDKGIYILITYGDPSYRLYLLKEPRLWSINLHVIDRPDAQSRGRWELTRPIPWKEDGSLDTAVLGSNAEVHYIYVCKKDESLQREDESKSSNECIFSQGTLAVNS